MNSIPTDAALAAWKRNLGLALEFAEALVEGAEKAREIQVAAAVETRAWLGAARKSLAAANELELASLQARLANELFGNIAQYWARFAANARDTHARMVQVLVYGAVPAPLLAGPPRSSALPASPFNDLIDAGYSQWLDTLRRFYPTPVG